MSLEGKKEWVITDMVLLLRKGECNSEWNEEGKSERCKTKRKEEYNEPIIFFPRSHPPSHPPSHSDVATRPGALKL